MSRLIDPIALKQSLAVSAILEDGQHIFDIIDAQPTIEERKIGKWIPCSETVDVPDYEVLACDEYGEYITGFLVYTDDQWLCESEEIMMYDPIAWMPLPEPFQEEDRK